MTMLAINSILQKVSDDPLSELVIQISIAESGITYSHLIMMPDVKINPDGSYTITAPRIVITLSDIQQQAAEILDQNNYLIRFGNIDVAIMVVRGRM